MVREAIVLASLVAMQTAAHQPAPWRLRLGEQRTFRLPENPSTGYSWRIDAAGSTNLALLEIVDRGHSREPHAPPGAPGIHAWDITPLAPGRVAIRFVYQRPWERKGGRSLDLVVDVTR